MLTEPSGGGPGTAAAGPGEGVDRNALQPKETKP